MSRLCIFVVKDDNVGIVALYKEEIEAEIRAFESEDRDLDFTTIGNPRFINSDRLASCTSIKSHYRVVNYYLSSGNV